MKSESIFQATTPTTLTMPETDCVVFHESRSELAAQLSVALANTYVLQLKTQSFHWNVAGPLFYKLHKLTETQYRNMALAVDEIAERIRSIGFLAPVSFRQFNELACVQEERGVPTADVMIEQLIGDHKICSGVLRQAVREAEKVYDVKTADLLTERIRQHGESTWMLRAILS
jgi:starvation-inducible DNA-binding protein